jgi:folate-binding protein YgfZ
MLEWRMPAPSDPLPVPLDRAELIEISGADALAFAHAQFGSDVAGLAPSSWQWSSWLTAQGRTRCFFALLSTAHDHLLIWLPLGGASAIRDALARFVLRAKVQLALREGWALCSLDEGPLQDDRSRRLEECLGGYAFAQPGPRPRLAWLGPAPASPPDQTKLDAWRLADIAAGLPWLDASTQDEFVPQALDLQRLDAVRFDKGCYPGQEIAARLHFRGGSKQRLHRLVLHGDRDAPPDMRIASAAGNAGVVLYSASVSANRREALAVLADASLSSLPMTSENGHAVEDISAVFTI